MKALVRSEQDITFVELVGFVDIESVCHFRKYCREKLFGHKVVVNMAQLNFVGSSGIFNFIDALKELSGTDGQSLRLCGGGPEFKRIFSLGTRELAYIFDNEQLAVRSFFEPQISEEALNASAMSLASWEESETDAPGGGETAVAAPYMGTVNDGTGFIESEGPLAHDGCFESQSVVAVAIEENGAGAPVVIAIPEPETK